MQAKRKVNFLATPIRPKVLVTNGEAKSALTVVWSLANRGIEVHVGAETFIAVACWSRFVKHRHQLPSSLKHPQEFVNELVTLQRKWKFDVVIPVAEDDIAALLSCDIGALGEFNMVLPFRQSFETAKDKSRMMKVAIGAGVPCPETYFPDEEAIESIRDRAQYPLLIKPNISAGARGITRVDRKEVLCALYTEIVAKWGASHLQELIPEGGGQFKADIVVGRQDKTLALFVCKKLRFYPVEGGSSTLITSLRHAQIERDVPKLTKALEWYGFADFDFIVDPRDGIAKLMECNPRFPESLAINVFAGMDFPWLLYQLALTGKAEPMQSYTDGLYARFFVGDIMWFLFSKERWKAQPNFFRFFGNDLQYYVERVNDPGPAICSFVEALLTILSPKQIAYRFDRGFSRKKTEK